MVVFPRRSPHDCVYFDYDPDYRYVVPGSNRTHPSDCRASRRSSKGSAVASAYAWRTRASIAPESGKSVSVTVPREAFESFLEVLGQLANGHAVTIVPVHAELTTQQAADMLNISRPHLIGLLEEGRIAFTKTGTHRRLRAADVIAYKAERDAEHAKTLRELTAEAQRLKLGY